MGLVPAAVDAVAAAEHESAGGRRRITTPCRLPDVAVPRCLLVGFFGGRCSTAAAEARGAVVDAARGRPRVAERLPGTSRACAAVVRRRLDGAASGADE